MKPETKAILDGPSRLNYGSRYCSMCGSLLKMKGEWVCPKHGRVDRQHVTEQ